MELNQNYITGWIKLFRSIRFHWIWKDEKKLKCWMDILLEVNHKDNKVNIGGSIFDCERGQSIMSLKNWADRWNISKDKARNFLKLLEKDDMILLENLTKTTRITVCNYDTYQPEPNANQTQTKRKPNANSPKQELKKERKKELFDEFWDLYDKKVGDKTKIFNKWILLSNEEINLIINYIPKYKLSQPNKKYRKDPSTFLNNKSWLDEIISDEVVVNNLHSYYLNQKLELFYNKYIGKYGYLLKFKKPITRIQMNDINKLCKNSHPIFYTIYEKRLNVNDSLYETFKSLL